MMDTKQDQQADVSDRSSWIWDAIFYATVLISTVLALGDEKVEVPFWVIGLLMAALLLWHTIGFRFIARSGGGWGEHIGARFVIVVGDVLLLFALITISPVFYLAYFGLFSQVFRQLPTRYAVVVGLLLTVATVYEQLSSSGQTFSLTNPIVWVFLLLGLAGILLGVWVSAIIGQSAQRRELIEQLEATQVELAAVERREGMLEERQRLAREIHDTLAQGFTSIVMHLEAAEQSLPNNLDALQKHLDEARTTARASLDQARAVVQDLRPDLLQDYALPDAIERTGGRWREETGLQLTTTVTGNPVPLHPVIEVTLLRAAQEALANVRKHAQATAVQLTLSYMGDVVVLDVQDNGVGLGGAEQSYLSGGYGLQAMRERVAQCGGFVELESDPGEGTTIVVTIPLAAENLAEDASKLKLVQPNSGAEK